MAVSPRPIGRELVGSREELDRLLELATNLQASVEQYERRADSYRLMAVVVAFLAFLAILIRWASIDFSNLNVQLTAVYIALFPLVTEWFRRRIIHRSWADRRALREVLQILREAYKAIGDVEGWSAIDRAEYQIRLSRFGIGDY